MENSVFMGMDVGFTQGGLKACKDLWRLIWQCCQFPYSFLFFSYLVTNLMGADLNNIVKFQRLSDEHVQFLIYQLLRGLKVI